ncbi:MAG: hypothetical protein ACP5GS_05415 [Nitrososphaeria archaeon]
MYRRWHTAKFRDESRRQYIKLYALSSAGTSMPSLIASKAE